MAFVSFLHVYSISPLAYHTRTTLKVKRDILKNYTGVRGINRTTPSMLKRIRCYKQTATLNFVFLFLFLFFSCSSESGVWINHHSDDPSNVQCATKDTLLLLYFLFSLCGEFSTRLGQTKLLCIRDILKNASTRGQL